MIVKKGEGFKEEKNTDVWGMDRGGYTFCHKAFKDGVIMEEGEYRCCLTSKDGQRRPYKK